jgi:SAM-dependent methyltransferase
MVSVHRFRRRGIEFLPWGVAEARMIERLLDPKSGDRLLEVGSSAGYRIEGYSGIGVELSGVDSDHDAIETGKRTGSPVNLIEADAGNLPFSNESFDRILCVHLLEHLPDPKKAIGEMARVLKPQGRAVIVVPCERIRGDTAFAGWWQFKNLHLHRFKPPQITSLLLPDFFIEEALFHTWIPGQFRKMPLDRTPWLYYLSQSMLFKLRRL